MALPTQTIGGLASGMDTNGIISSLVDIEKVSLKRLETKKEKEQLYLQAYYSVNSLLKEFLTSAEELAKETMWKTKGATSSNESVLTADVTENALPGTYSFRVGQLATSSRYMSGGFSSMDNPVLVGGASGGTVSKPASLYTLLSSLNDGAGVDKSELFLEFTDAFGNAILDSDGNAAKFTINPAALASCNTINDVMAVVSGAAQQSGFMIKAIDNGDGTFAISYSSAVEAEINVNADYNINRWTPGSGLQSDTVSIGDKTNIFSVLDGSYVGSYDYALNSFYETVNQKDGGWYAANGSTIDFDADNKLTDNCYFINGAYTTRGGFESAANDAGYSFVKNSWSDITDGTTLTSSNLVDGNGDPLELTFDTASGQWKDGDDTNYSSFKFIDDDSEEITATYSAGVWSYKNSAGENSDFTLNGTTHNFTAEHWEDGANNLVDTFSFTNVDGDTYAFFAQGLDESDFAAAAPAATASTTGSWNTDGFSGALTLEQSDAINALAEVINAGKLSINDLKTALSTPQNGDGTWQDRADAFDDVIAASGVIGNGLTSANVAAIADLYDKMLTTDNTLSFDSALSAIGSGATIKDVRDGFIRSAQAAIADDAANDPAALTNQDFHFYADNGVIVHAQSDASGEWSFTNTAGDNVDFTYRNTSIKFTPDTAGITHRDAYYQRETVTATPTFKIEIDGKGDATWNNKDADGNDIPQSATAVDVMDDLIQPGQVISGFRFSGATAASLGIDALTIEADANGATKNAVNSLYGFVGSLDSTKQLALVSALGTMSGLSADAASDETIFLNALDAAGYTDAAYHTQRTELISAFGAISDSERQTVIDAFQVNDLLRAKTSFLNAAVDPSGGSFKATWNPGMAKVEEKGQQGYLTIENAGGQAVRNVLVSDLNGGAGIYHGSIEVTNKDGKSTTVDLSTAATLNDVLDKINASQGIGVIASLNDNGDGIKLTDYTGGAGTLKVYNSGLGTTAADLGLTTLDANGNGANINKLTEKTQLSMLRNGMGINDGEPGNMLINCDGKDYVVDAKGCGTIGDLIWAIQNATASTGEKLSDKAGVALEDNRLVLNSVYRVAVISDISEDQSNTTAEDLGLVTGTTAYQRVEGLALTSSLNSVSLYNVTGKRSFDGETNLSMFGIGVGETLSITDKSGGTAEFTSTADSTLADLLEFFNDSGNGASVAMYLEPDRGSIALGDLTSIVEDAVSISVGGSMADKLGFDSTHNSASGANNGIRGAQIYFAGIAGIGDSFVRDAATGKLSANLGNVKMTVGSTDLTLDLSSIKADSSMSDLLKTLNAQAAAQVGANKITFQLNEAKNGIEVVNNSGQNVSFKNDGNSTARDLGLDTIQAASGTSANAGNLDTKWLGRAYSLEKLTGQATISGSISIINTHGGITAVDLTGCKTVGEVIDMINDSGSGVFASINDAGDGMLLTDTYGGLGAISVSEVAGGSLAKQLGILGSSGGAQHNGSFQRDILVGQSDTLRDLMNKISESGLDISASIINDGTSSAPYRLTISSRTSGYGSEFVIDTNVTSLGMTQTSKGQDAAILYGESSGLSTMLLSNTNSNNKAILGVTLNANKVSDEWTTVTVKQEKEQAVEAVQKLVDAYNSILTMVNQYSEYTYDEETKKQTKGIFFGDTNIRRLTTQMQEMFFTVAETKSGGYSMWYDLGVKFQDDGTLALDKTVLQDAVNADYDAVYNLLVKSTNVGNAAGGNAAGSSSAVKGSITSGATITTSGKADVGFDRLGASNGDKTFKSFGIGNGFCSAEPFGLDYPKTEDGSQIGTRGYMYEVLFDKTRTLDKVYIYHVDTEDMPAAQYALKDFKVEYLNPNTNEWEELRTISDNAANANYLGFALPTACKGIRINATSTNAEDGKFRLTEVECYEAQGLASNMLQTTKLMTDIIDGWFAGIQSSTEEKISRISADIDKENTRLENYESNLIRKYASMETVMANLQAQSTTIDNYLSTTSSSKK